MSLERVRKSAATKLGITLDEYDTRIAGGERWCSGHQCWHPVGEFSPTAHYCREFRRGDDAEKRRQDFRNWLLARVLAK